MSNLVAVYGSLREGLHNHRLLEMSERVGDGLLSGFNMYSFGAFPAITDAPDSDVPITVEVYRVDEETMQQLDWLEGYPSFYDRKVVSVCSTSGETLDAWTYFIAGLDRSEEELVSDGDWVQFYNSANGL